MRPPFFLLFCSPSSKSATTSPAATSIGRRAILSKSRLYANVGLAITIGLERVRGRTGSIVHNIGAIVMAALTLLAIACDLIYVLDPLVSAARPSASPFVNLILLAYGLPAMLAITLALIARTTRPLSYRIVAAITAVTLGLFYLTLEVRRLFHGPILAGRFQRRRAIHLLDGVAPVRHRAACHRLYSALAAGADPRPRRDRADRRQGVHHRHREHQRHLPRAIGDRSRRRAARHRLALSAPALSARAGPRRRPPRKTRPRDLRSWKPGMATPRWTL